ncbi:MAG: type II toxin-antitoxin system VapC family toxin [Chloroflexota bacterium]|nr:type II toxin-antitoxin system VapC family toxin [Chloroflexota bacterium]
MKLLLDTCTFLWLATDAPELSRAARASCRDPANEVYLSSLSAWEIAIKHRLGRLPLPEPPTRYVASRRRWLQLEPLPFDESSAVHDVLLPPLHPDPFDRGLVAQAILNHMTVVTPDPAIAQYPAPVLW